MPSTTIESYLVGLGFSVDRPQFAQFTGALHDAEGAVVRHTSGVLRSMAEWQLAITGAFTAVGLGTIALADHVADADQQYRLLGLRMFMTQDRARSLKIATDALGASMEEIAWDPELHARFEQLISDQERMGKALGLGANYEDQMRHIRDIRFEFTRLGVEAKFLTFGLVSQLFTQLGVGPDVLQKKLGDLNDWIQGNIPAMSAWIAQHLLPVLGDWKKIMFDTGGALEEAGLAFTNLVGALTGDTSLESTTFSFGNMSKAIGEVAHALGVVVEDALLAERAMLHFAQGVGFGLQSAMAAAHGNWKDEEKLRSMASNELKAFAGDLNSGSGGVLGYGAGGAIGTVVGGIVGGPLGAIAGGMLGSGAGAVSGAVVGHMVNGSGESGMRAGPAGYVGGSPNSAISGAITDTALRYHVDPFLAHAVAQQESGEREYDSRGNVVTSSAGAMGVMQLMPRTAQNLGVDARDAGQNITGGMTELARLLDKYADTTKALEAYNWGEGKLDKALRTGGKIPQEVQDYASSIEAKAHQLTIQSLTVNVHGTNMTHDQVASAVTDGVNKGVRRNLNEVAGVYR